MNEIKLKLKTPVVPNFISVIMPGSDDTDNNPKVSLCDLSAEQIDAMAEDWRKKLHENAERQRNQKF